MILFTMMTTWIAYTAYMDVAVINAGICKELDVMEADPAKYIPKEEAAMVAACLSGTPLNKVLHINNQVEPVKVAWPTELNASPKELFAVISSMKTVFSAMETGDSKLQAKQTNAAVSALESHLSAYMTKQNEVEEKIKPVTMAAETLSTADCSNVAVAYREVKSVVCGEILTSLSRLAMCFLASGVMLLVMAILVPCSMTRMKLLAVQPDRARGKTQ